MDKIFEKLINIIGMMLLSSTLMCYCYNIFFYKLTNLKLEIFHFIGVIAFIEILKIPSLINKSVVSYEKGNNVILKSVQVSIATIISYVIAFIIITIIGEIYDYISLFTSPEIP